MRDLSVDERGYVVPWFVDWLDGKPEFRAMDRAKFFRAIKEKLCWVCGGRLGVHVTFVAGPMCGINRTSSEPPCHRECAEWSAVNCPFLANPRMVRRDADLPDGVAEMSGFGIKRNPGVAMLWHTRGYEVFRAPNNGGVLITMGEPESVDWYAFGRTATREEVLESIESGLPNILELARMEKGGIEHLDRSRARFEKWLPA
jgi:hypothetical protein